jgi:hypothetical protein
MTSTAPEEHAPPALYDHCVRTYNAMLAEAKKHQVALEKGIDRVEGHDTHVIIYEGFLTQLITQKLNLSVPYYTKIRNALIRMGCVRQLRRGGGSSPSQWELNYEPSLDAFLKQEAPKVPKQDKYAALEQQISNLTRRIADLERSRDAMVEAFAQKFGVEELEDKDV